MAELKIVILYDAAQNRYCVLAHNSTAESAGDIVRLNEARGTAIILEQAVQHREPNPACCRTCREIVRRQAHIQPIPKFVRRIL